MPANLVRAGAQLVHPDKAFVLRHLPPPEDADTIFQTDPNDAYVSRAMFEASQIPAPRLDYILRLQAGIEALFGSMDLDLHCYRVYDAEEGLAFHSDTDDPLGREQDIIRMVTCVHNINDADRVLEFRKPLWTGHTESFTLPIPAKGILAFGDALMFDYEHGISPHPSVAAYRSVVTRFLKEAPDE